MATGYIGCLTAHAGGIMAKRPTDTNRLAKQIIDEATADKNPAAVALGRLGGLKGGKARREALSPEKRAEIAKKAAKARWHKP
jgi:hypothetical protein